MLYSQQAKHREVEWTKEFYFIHVLKDNDHGIRSSNILIHGREDKVKAADDYEKMR